MLKIHSSKRKHCSICVRNILPLISCRVRAKVFIEVFYNEPKFYVIKLECVFFSFKLFKKICKKIRIKGFAFKAESVQPKGKVINLKRSQAE